MIEQTGKSILLCLIFALTGCSEMFETFSVAKTGESMTSEGQGPAETGDPSDLDLAASGLGARSSSFSTNWPLTCSAPALEDAGSRCDSRHLPKPEKEGDKQARGRVLVIAGSVEIPGAAVLAGLGSLRAGAEILQIATCRSSAGHLGMAMPEAMVIACRETNAGGIDPASAERLIELGSDCDAVLIGPGMTDPVAVAELTQTMLKRLEGPVLVLDALAFSTLTADEMPKRRTGKIVVTPHSGEMAKVWALAREDVDQSPLNSARRAAAALPAVVAMKGAETYVVAEKGRACLAFTKWLHRSGYLRIGGHAWPAFSPVFSQEALRLVWRRRGQFTCMVRLAGT